MTATTEGTVAVIIPAGVTSPGNTASATLSKVCYPPTGAGHIWVGHGYSGSRLGTYTDPFDLMADGLDWLKAGGTLHVFSGSNPETIRITPAAAGPVVRRHGEGRLPQPGVPRRKGPEPRKKSKLYESHRGWWPCNNP